MHLPAYKQVISILGQRDFTHTVLTSVSLQPVSRRGSGRGGGGEGGAGCHIWNLWWKIPNMYSLFKLTLVQREENKKENRNNRGDFRVISGCRSLKKDKLLPPTPAMREGMCAQSQMTQISRPEMNEGAQGAGRERLLIGSLGEGHGAEMKMRRLTVVTCRSWVSCSWTVTGEGGPGLRAAAAMFTQVRETPEKKKKKDIHICVYCISVGVFRIV